MARWTVGSKSRPKPWATRVLRAAPAAQFENGTRFTGRRTVAKQGCQSSRLSGNVERCLYSYTCTEAPAAVASASRVSARSARRAPPNIHTHSARDITHCPPRLGSCSFERGCLVALWSCGCDGGGTVPVTIPWTTTSAAPRMHLLSALRPASVQRCLAVSVGLCFACRVLWSVNASRAVPVEQLIAWFANSESPVQVDGGGTHALCRACRCHQ